MFLLGLIHGWKAIIVAAGFGYRMALVTKISKPLVTVNGVRIIDRLLDALYSRY